MTAAPGNLTRARWYDWFYIWWMEWKYNKIHSGAGGR